MNNAINTYEPLLSLHYCLLLNFETTAEMSNHVLETYIHVSGREC